MPPWERKRAWEEHGKVKLLPHKRPTHGHCSGLRVPRLPLLKTHLKGRGEFPNLLAFCLEAGVPGSLSIPYQPVLAVLMLSQVCNHAYGARGAWALRGQPLAPFRSFFLWPNAEFGNAGNTSKALCLCGLWGMKHGVFLYVKAVGLGF